MNIPRPWAYAFVAVVVIIAVIGLIHPSLDWLKSAWPEAKSANTKADPSPVNAKTRDIHLFTVEYKTLLSGKEKEVYRFDPGTVIVMKGEKIRLHIHGLNGKVHHFSIPELKVAGSVEKGKIATLEFTADRTGTFELICHDHITETHEGPMIGYVTVVHP
ncbi:MULTISPECIES: cupredoxin domain-containing protein [Thermoactinomyces]|jgi:heme/copper-type cytochrome/quinol oxidase subunit 2|uniref:Cupredoxin domain-containing protein n=1 Tax=Thermoactinomyces daqus TaxID=1329516 RepID=A0A7W1XCL7_9BACL|nr:MULTISPECIES: cupredoxin domain-containing protein [Thermoactinomyces]MBA4544072.1 cupredoxin domain-containing protein [Thermoactinomyces daqus]MBH8598215.1 cupredoxin domain-containing protein [Thermoactinomyces sp. CICC 10523]MBH8603244.1 cupredoxin domain-containing protein [Thermoactinomyces sp. CICC 10522]MBH8608600.1 cupredoxin domain-containing protein [Thermoactinomyces sp. CICC 10521]